MTEQIREFQIKGATARHVARGLSDLEGWYDRGFIQAMGSYTNRSGDIYYIYDREEARLRTIRVERIEFSGDHFSVSFDPLRAPMTRVITPEQLIEAIAKRSTIFRIKGVLGRILNG